jgi:hypothetical protein
MSALRRRRRNLAVQRVDERKRLRGLRKAHLFDHFAKDPETMVFHGTHASLADFTNPAR